MDMEVEARGRLRALAALLKDKDDASAARLEQLATALGGPAAAAWVGVRLHEIFDREALAEALAPDAERRPFWTEVARNTLVLVPVLLTWLAISQAIAAYGQLSEAAREKPFLVLWAGRFDGQLPWLFRLDTVTLLDAAILIAVIVLTLWVYWRTRTVEHVQRTQLEHARREVDETLAMASLALAEKATTSPEQLVATFGMIGRELLAQLDKERQRLEDLTKQRERESVQLAHFARELREGMTALFEVTKSFADHYPVVADAMGRTATGLERLTPSQEAIQKRLDLVQERLEAVSRQSGELLTTVSQIATGLTSTVDAVAGASGDLSGAVVQFSGDAQRLAQGTDEFLSTIQEERKAQGLIARELARVSTTLREVLLRIQEDARLFRVLAVDLHQVKDATPGVVAAQREAGEQLTLASREITTNAREVTQMVSELRAVLVRMESRMPNGLAGTEL